MQKKELGQYPTILTSCFVNNVYVLVNILISDIFCFFRFWVYEVETKEKEKLAEIKNINYNIYAHIHVSKHFINIFTRTINY